MGEGESHPWWASRNDSRVAGYWTESPGRKRHLQWCPLASCSTLKEVDWQRTWRPPTPYRSMHQTLWFRDSLGREQGRSTKAQGHPCVYIYICTVSGAKSDWGIPVDTWHPPAEKSLRQRTRPHGCSSKCLLCSHRGPGPAHQTMVDRYFLIFR